MTQTDDKTYTWINDNNPEIARLVDDLDPFVGAVQYGATPLLSEISGGLTYSFAMAETTPKGRALAAQAIYRYLHERCEMIYENDDGFREGKQFIRSQTKVGEKRVGTCIDLTLLILACLSRAKLKPLYVHLKSKSGDHAIVGVWLDTTHRRKQNPDVELKLDLVQELVEEKHFLLLEATGVTIGTPWNQEKLPFDVACQQGATLPEKHQHQGFVIDFDAAWKNGFWPESSGKSEGAKIEHRLPAPEMWQSYLEPKRKDFTGRQWLFDDINKWLKDPKAQKSLLVLGDPGIGKSAIVAALVERNEKQQVLAYHCCRADSPNTRDPAWFVRNLAAHVAKNLPAYAARLRDPDLAKLLEEGNCRQDPGQALERGILEPLKHFKEPWPCYLLIDALDEALGDQNNIVTLLSSRLQQFPPWLRILATSRRENDVISQLRMLPSIAINAHDDPNKKDVHDYVRHRLFLSATPGREGLAAKFAESGLTEERALAIFTEKSEGNFLYLRQVFDGLEDGVYTWEKLEEIPPGLEGLYTAFFSRHFPLVESKPRGYGDARQLLEVVLAARAPLSDDDLATASGLERYYSYREVTRILNCYLPLRDGRRVVFHKSFADWLANPERNPSYFVEPLCGHQRLADAGLRAWQSQGRNLRGYFLDHLPHHLAAQQRWDDWANVMTNLGYLETRAEQGGVFRLIEDFSSCELLPIENPQRHRLRLLRDVLRIDGYFLSRHPQSLCQCFYNRCWWHDHPSASQHFVAPETGWPSTGLPWQHPSPKAYELVETWRCEKKQVQPHFSWLRALRPLPEQLDSSLRAVLAGHDANVHCVAYSPDGRKIASASFDNTVRVWDAASGECLEVIESTWDAAAVFDPATGVAVVYRAEKREGDYAIVEVATDKVVAWFPQWLVKSSADGRVWARDSGNQVVLLRLEQG